MLEPVPFHHPEKVIRMGHTLRARILEAQRNLEWSRDYDYGIRKRNARAKLREDILRESARDGALLVHIRHENRIRN